MKLQPEERIALYGGLRQLGYVAGCLGIMFVQLALARVYHQDTFKELHLVENLQFSLLVVSALVFFAFAAGERTRRRPLGWLLASFCLLAACREMDILFDDCPFLSWKIGFVFPAAALIYDLARWPDFLRATLRFAGRPPCIMLIAAVIIIAVGQLIGHKPFLIDLLGPFDHVSRLKEVFEEGVETVGYFTILCASIELFCTRKTYLENLPARAD